MADTFTTNLNLTKPEPGAAEDTWGISLNADLDALDAIFSSNGTSVALNLDGAVIDSSVIGSTTAAAGSFTTLSASTSITGTLATAAQPNITSLGTLTGLTTTGDINFGDNDKAIFGASSDLQIYHDGSSSFVADAGTGQLRLLGDDVRIMNAAGTEISAQFIQDGEARLKYNNITKLATKTGGIDVTGTATMDGLTVDGTNGTFAIAADGNTVTMSRAGSNYFYASNASGDLFLGAGGSASFLKIDNSGDISFYEDTGTTAKLFWDASDERLNLTGSDYQLGIKQGSNESWYHRAVSDGSYRLHLNATGDILSATSTGIDVTGVITTDGLTTTGNINLGDNDKAVFGAGSDLQIYHDGFNSYIDDSGNGDLKIRSGNIYLEKYTGETMLYADADGAVTLYHDNAAKLATTSTGIDVTGTVVSDGLNVDTGTLSVDSTNNRVGIGNTSPTEKLHVQGTALMSSSKLSTNNGTTYWDIRRDSSTGHFVISDDGLGDVVTIKQDSGNVGIGTSSPDRKLHINESASATSNFIHMTTAATGASGSNGFLVGIGSAGNAELWNYEAQPIIFATSSSERMRIDSSGSVGIGTTSPSEALHVTGNILASGNITAFSDERLKDNIETLQGSKVLDMRGVSYTKDGEVSSGVIAQEIEKVAPELVHTAKDEMGTKSVAYGNLVGYLIEAIKDQQKQINDLKERLDNGTS